MSDHQALRPDRAALQAVPVDEFTVQLRESFRPRDQDHEEQIRRAVTVLADRALEDTKLVAPDAVRTVQALIAELDKKLTAQVNLILHHPDYQQMESAWRGLHHLVTSTEDDETLKIRFMSISKRELGRTLQRFEGAWEQSPIFGKIYTEGNCSTHPLGEKHFCINGL